MLRYFIMVNYDWMRTRYQQILLSAIVCFLSFFPQNSHAQAIPLLTDPLKVQEIELLSEKLDMTPVQQESMLELYDRYLVDFARVRNGDVKTFEDSITEAAEDFGFMSLNIPEREEVEKLISQFDRSIRSIQRVDKLFFDEIGGMLTETQQRRLLRYQVAREVEAYMALKMVAEFNRGAGIHISELYDRLRVEDTPEVLLLLETYEKRYLNLAKETYEALTETEDGKWGMMDGESLLDHSYYMGSHLKIWEWRKREEVEAEAESILQELNKTSKAGKKYSSTIPADTMSRKKKSTE